MQIQPSVSVPPENHESGHFVPVPWVSISINRSIWLRISLIFPFFSLFFFFFFFSFLIAEICYVTLSDAFRSGPRLGTPKLKNKSTTRSQPTPPIEANVFDKQGSKVYLDALLQGAGSKQVGVV